MEAVDARAEFLAQRRLGIGGSDAPIILGLSTWKTPLQLWAEKTGRAKDTADNPILRRGRKLEAVVASEYEEETGRTLAVSGRGVHPKHDWMIGNRDRAIYAKDREGEGTFEGKAANVFKMREWAEEAPLAAQVQTQHYCAVYGTSWGSVAGLLGGLEFRYQDLDANPQFIERLIEHEAKFWKLVQDDTPPEPMASDAPMLSRLFEAIEGRSIDLPDEAIEWDRQRLEASAEIKRLELLKNDADAKLKFAIGAAEIGVLPGGGSYTFKLKKGYTEKAARVVEATRVLLRSTK